MTVVNRSYLLTARPIVDMHGKKLTGPGGTSYGLGEAGYDIRIKQDIKFYLSHAGNRMIAMGQSPSRDFHDGRFILASAIEEFNMPPFLTGIVHDKSTWARRGLSVFNTVIEPGWKGFLTLELVYHGKGELIIPAGSGIAQVMFHEVQEPAFYKGKYQFQADEPVGALDSE
jgi:dCTP deaminase